MKRYFLLFILLGSLLSGCSSESSEPPTTAALYGYVSDKVTGQPVAAAQVSLCLYDGYGSMVATSITGSDGYFAFSSIKPTLYAVKVVHSQYKYFLEQVRLEAGSQNEISLLVEPLR